jgi:TfoX/Sxy family transcriptional regulator of competence genes
VAYDELLANRIRELIGAHPNLTEKKMFGGLAFLIGGNMAIAASGQGGVLVRVDPVKSQSIVAKSDADTAVMQGRAMAGWLRVSDEHVSTQRQLGKWVKLGVDYAGSLPLKTKARRNG